MKLIALAMLVAGAVVVGAPMAQAAAGPVDYAQTARNIIPSGEPGAIRSRPAPTPLTPLAGHVTDAVPVCRSPRPSARHRRPGKGGAGSLPGVTIIRDRFDVPHVTATTHDGGVWAAGWIAAEDRGLLLAQAYDSRVAAIDAPGLSAIGLVEHLKNFVPSRQTENVVARQTQVLLKAGPEGRAVLHDIDVYVTGINAYLTATHSSAGAVHPHRHLRLQRAQGPVLR